ncbi:MAG: hypothetical protein DRR19_09090 [Candidatus Parabeggiatoa sp. nov. 1]|nr:MAG: hypothetical protein DRR19_09090 [Gammaproteobacteria bacterium]HEC84949.1 hypothetical protein [Thioploca sp.]
MYTKDDEDWFNLLGGKSVPDADPETVEEAMALRGALRALREGQHLPPLPDTTPKREPWKFSAWLQEAPVRAYAMASVLIVVMLIPIFIKIVPSPEGTTKSFPFFLELITTEPQNTAQNIHNALQAQGIESTQKQDDNIWILDIQFEPSQHPELAEILAHYNLQLSSDKFNRLIVEIKPDEHTTTP